jgi:hypothetical protein
VWEQQTAVHIHHLKKQIAAQGVSREFDVKRPWLPAQQVGLAADVGGVGDDGRQPAAVRNLVGGVRLEGADSLIERASELAL